jgi:hypothetical protein
VDTNYNTLVKMLRLLEDIVWENMIRILTLSVPVYLALKILQSAHGEMVVAPSKYNPVFLKTTIIDMDQILKDSNLLNTCRSLSLERGSGINVCLDEYIKLSQHRSIDACGIFAYYINHPVGWLLYSYECDYIYFKAEKCEAVSHIYVHPDWRRLGIGTKLIHTASRMADPDTLRVYDYNAPLFFQPLMGRINNILPVV